MSSMEKTTGVMSFVEETMEETAERVCRRVEGLYPLERWFWGGAAVGPGEVQAAGGQGQAEPAELLPTRTRRDALHAGCGQR